MLQMEVLSYLVGNPEPLLQNTVHGSHGGGIVDADDCCGNMLQAQQVLRQPVPGFIIIRAIIFIIFGAAGQLVSGQDLPIAHSLFIGGGHIVPTADHGDVPVPQG